MLLFTFINTTNGRVQYNIMAVGRPIPFSSWLHFSVLTGFLLGNADLDTVSTLKSCEICNQTRGYVIPWH